MWRHLTLGVFLLGVGLAGAQETPPVPKPAPPEGQTPGLATLWTYGLAQYAQRDVAVGLGAPPGATAPAPDLARLGKPSSWTAAGAASAPERAMDGDPETFSAAPGLAANAADLPQDIGVTWDTPRPVAQVRVVYHGAAYTPALEGQDLQVWDGQDWVSVPDETLGGDTPTWVHTFAPVRTTRLRLLVTRFSRLGLAIRSFEVYSEPVQLRRLTMRTAATVAGLFVTVLPGDPQPRVVVASGASLMVLGATGKLIWETDLPASALALATQDLEGDGRPEIVVAAGAALYCHDGAGNRLWEAQCPTDRLAPEGEPARGALRVLACADLDGDGKGEVVVGSDNGFVYAFDHQGGLRWSAPHQAGRPSAIATVVLPAGAGEAALLATQDGPATLFSAGGKRLGTMGTDVTAVATGDMDGDGRPELIAGSRSGVIQAQTWGADATWKLDLRSEVTALTMADVTGDGRPELLAGVRDGRVVAVDAGGKALWTAATGAPVLSLAAADVTGDPGAEVIAGGAGGQVATVSATGELLARQPTPGDATRLVAADLDGDARAEVITATSEGRLHCLRPLP